MTDQKDPERVIICDSETCYGERLMEYLKGHLPFPCEMELYTSAEKRKKRERWKCFASYHFGERVRKGSKGDG